jgi:hypothetical protein
MVLRNVELFSMDYTVLYLKKIMLFTWVIVKMSTRCLLQAESRAKITCYKVSRRFVTVITKSCPIDTLPTSPDRRKLLEFRDTLFLPLPPLTATSQQIMR